MKKLVSLIALGMILALFAVNSVSLVGAILLVSLLAMATNSPTGKLCAVTLSVPEIMMDVLDAFKLELPEVFGPDGVATDFSSKTAVLGDKITAKIAKLPVTGAYDRNNGGFKAATQDVTGLFEDVPVTLNQFRIVTINVNWLTQLASKLPLYKEAVRNNGYVLCKYVLDAILANCVSTNFSNAVTTALANVNLDTFDGSIRDQLNTQKAYNRGRFAIISTGMASKLGADDRVKSSLFYNALNANEGYRVWRNLAGFSWVREYPDMPTAGNLIGFAGDKRSHVVAVRPIDFSNAADMLGIPKVMQFYPVVDELTGISATGAAWQEAGTGDVYVSLGILFGIGSGQQNTGAGLITDNAGLRIVTP